ncbi:hypothetical protein N9Z39_03915, partial [Alphaproteobacteria bacterium]|nr:hypothetical protein [Alphaproteobacteria bacterium]
AVVDQILALAAQNPLTADAQIAGDGYLKFTLDAKTQHELGTLFILFVWACVENCFGVGHGDDRRGGGDGADVHIRA